jgi:hypothetical protein
MRRPSPLALLLAVPLACSDGALAARPGTPCASLPAAARRPLTGAELVGDWWAEGSLPPTVRFAVESGTLRGDLAFSGVARPGGVGTVTDGCLRMTFPAAPGTTGPTMQLEGASIGEGRLRVVLDGATAFVLVRRSRAPEAGTSTSPTAATAPASSRTPSTVAAWAPSATSSAAPPASTRATAGASAAACAGSTVVSGRPSTACRSAARARKAALAVSISPPRSRSAIAAGARSSTNASRRRSACSEARARAASPSARAVEATESVRCASVASRATSTTSRQTICAAAIAPKSSSRASCSSVQSCGSTSTTHRLPSTCPPREAGAWSGTAA